MRLLTILVTGFLILSLPAYAEEKMGGMMGGKGMAEGQAMMMDHPANSRQAPARAEAQLYDGQGKKIGQAVLTQEQNGVKVAVVINKMPEGIYALHIHETGQCDAPDFKSSGGHFNPYGKEHGFLNSKGPHAGDLPNIEVEEDGTGSLTVTTNYLTLKEGAANSLLKPGGTAVVIHQGPDDYLSDPAGKGGPRVACGVIEVVK